ncbi:hypothetical protein [Cellulomonas sp. B6]|uniref:hypothetical protein n=1 Tax=Cellulomonas sp. B6 TaxID=1295626 RepID=UPI00073CE00A|nr:hypothetical protein [Cellulomonas sp. B6]KSW28897.1 hypothetical protein ATM99_10525 [Cellulomonas sp. B6]
MRSSPDLVAVPRAAGTGGPVATAWLDVAFVILCFAPYACLPLGESTNIPVTGLLWPLWLPRILRHRAVVVTSGVLAFAPTVTAFLGLLAGRPVDNPVALLTWVLYLAPVPVLAVVVLERPRLAARALGTGVAVSAVLALVQHQLILRGVLPFAELYDVPGYATVNPDTVLMYVKRPFGQFPEPSFMAGSLALASAAYLLVRRTWTARLGLLDHALVGLVLVVLVVSRSGSTVVAGLAVLGMLLVPAARGLRRPVVVMAVALGGAYVAASVVSQRSASTDFSWGDRAVSIVAAGRYLLTDPVALVVGIGRGRAAHLFSTGAISTSGYEAGGAIYDVYSVLGRAALESGVVFGLVLLVVGAGLHVQAHRRTGVTHATAVGILAALLWVVVAGFTISYDSAALIWSSVGVALGVVVRPRTPGSDVGPTGTVSGRQPEERR